MIAKVFFDVPPGFGIPGLLRLAREKKAKVGDGRALMFMNRKRTRVKILFDETTMFVYAKDHDEISIEELKALPAIVKGEWFDDAISKSIIRWLNQPMTPVSSLVRASA